jgi:hypothetical protein
MMDCSLYWNDISIGEKYVIENKRKINGKRERREIQILKKKNKEKSSKKTYEYRPGTIYTPKTNGCGERIISERM